MLVATPIGNLGDISRRAAEELRGADVIACEDTRRTGRLLAHLGLTARNCIVVNEHSEERQIPALLQLLRDGKRVALVCDAGTPGIADPGERVVASVASAGGEITIVPGPSAPVAAVALSGLSLGRYVYEGFLPRGGKARGERLAELALSPRSVVLLESPHRLERTARDLAAAFGPRRRVAAVRELTKLHEEVFRGTLVELCERAGGQGEVVLVIEGAPKTVITDEDILSELSAEGPLSVRSVADEVSRRLGVSRSRVYKLALNYPQANPEIVE